MKQPVKKQKEESTEKPKRRYIVNIDLIKETYAKNNPTLKPLTNADLARETGKNPQLFSDWNSESKDKPDTPLVLLKLCEIGGLTLEQIIKYVD